MNRENEKARIAETLRNIAGMKEPEEKAEIILDKIGSFKNFIESNETALSGIIGKTAARKIAAILPTFRAYCAALVPGKQIANRIELENYCKSLLLGERVEKFVVICVNAQCKIIGERVISTGSISEVSAFPRLVLETVLNYNAHSVFFTHNHPGGTCAPSREDINSTIQLKNVLKAIDVHVLDHMIIAGDKGYSMSQHGDISFN